MSRVAQFDLTTDSEGSNSIPAQVAGKDASLVVDTGNIYSTLNGRAADALNLTRRSIARATIVDSSVHVFKQYVIAVLTLENLKTEMPFLVNPDGHDFKKADGTIGSDILRAYDDDFDFANAKFSFFERQACNGNLTWWTDDPHAEIPFEINASGQIELQVQLDGKAVKAVIATGSPRSIVDIGAAVMLFGGAAPTDQSTPFVTGHGLSLPLNYAFKTLTFGGVTVNSPKITVYPIGTTPIDGDQMIIGLDVLKKFHIYVAYGLKKLFVTPASAH